MILPKKGATERYSQMPKLITRDDIKKWLEGYINKLGWSIIPVDKNKRAIFSWKQYQQEKLGIDEMFEKADETKKAVNGLAVVTGKISGVTVIDFDEGSEDIFEGVSTPTVRTGSGGKHYYFKYTDKISQGANSELKIDVRNDGGYAILPPSKSTKGEYSWIISPKDTEFQDLPDYFIDSYSKKSSSKPFDFSGIGDGGRNNKSVRVVGRLINSMPDEPQLAFEAFKGWNLRCNPPLNEKQLKSTFKWVWDTHHKNNPEITSSNLSEVISATDFSNKETIPTGFGDFDTKTGGLWTDSLTVIAAQTGVGKTLIVLNILNNILESTNKKIAYIDLENGIKQTIERFYRIKYGKNKTEWNNIKGDKQKLSEAIDEAFQGRLNVIYPQSGVKTYKSIERTLEREVKNGVDIIAIDPLQHIKEWESLDGQRNIVAGLSNFTQRNNISIILCHHVRKSTTAGGRYVESVDEIKPVKYLDPTIEDIKGGSVITDTAEVVWAVTRGFASEKEDEKAQKMARSKISLRVLKCRGNADAPGVYRLYLDIDTLRVVPTKSQLSYFEEKAFNF